MRKVVKSMVWDAFDNATLQFVSYDILCIVTGNIWLGSVVYVYQITV